ncbi:MAG: hypothetical protein VX294_04685 [Candidatus Latescibacterota bacterium]|nr:hypothetical protein [Candidatus Latescibacterota bacterium]
MSIFETLTSLNLAPETKVNLSYSEGVDVFVHNETEVETALSETDVVSTFAELVATPGLTVTSQYGTDVLESLRDAELLENYERGTFAFSEYLAETISENFYDVDLIEYSTEKYDHKRGFTTLSAEVQVTLENFVETQPELIGWEVSVKTEKGTLVLG